MCVGSSYVVVLPEHLKSSICMLAIWDDVCLRRCLYFSNIISDVMDCGNESLCLRIVE